MLDEKAKHQNKVSWKGCFLFSEMAEKVFLQREMCFIF